MGSGETVRVRSLSAITDVAGLLVGQAEDATLPTGVTVVLPDRRAVAAVDVRGGGPATRETDALADGRLVQSVDAIVLAGGSAYGLAAADGVVAWLASAGRGFDVGPMEDRRIVVPVVPAACLFDLGFGPPRGWIGSDATAEPPFRALAVNACRAAGRDVREGNVGAGAGATAGPYKGGVGTASAPVAALGATVGALMAVNARGTPVMPGQDCLWAWPLERAGELGGQPRPAAAGADDGDGGWPADGGPAAADAAGERAHTTLGVVATDAIIDRDEAARIAVMAQDGLARALRPAHTPFDGDALFVLSTGRVALPAEAGLDRAAAIGRLGAVAADVVARAIGRGVFAAEPAGGWPSYRQRHGAGLGGGAA